jgi:hypothetical protein
MGASRSPSERVHRSTALRVRLQAHVGSPAVALLGCYTVGARVPTWGVAAREQALLRRLMLMESYFGRRVFTGGQQVVYGHAPTVLKSTPSIFLALSTHEVMCDVLRTIRFARCGRDFKC